MNITKEDLNKKINQYVIEMHDIIKKDGKYNKASAGKIQKLSEALFNEIADMEMDMDDILECLPGIYIMQLIQAVVVANALCVKAFQEKLKNEEMNEALGGSFDLGFKGLEAGVCSYYHKFIEHGDDNGK